VVFSGDSRCLLPAVWDAWIGCEHEHVAPSGVCDAHVLMVECSTGWRCQNCYEASGQIVHARFIKKEEIHVQ
jgi:hypothetical protein